MKILPIEYCHQCRYHEVIHQEEVPQNFIKSTYGCELTGEQLHWHQKEFPSSCRLEDSKKEREMLPMWIKDKGQVLKELNTLYEERL